MSWKALAEVAATDLAEARTHAHHAVQIVAATGETHLTHVADTSHTAMTWDDATRAFVGHPIPTDAGALRVGVALPTLTLFVADAAGARHYERELGGATLADALDRTAEALGRVAGARFGGPLRQPAYDLPSHPLGDGAAFVSDAPSLDALADAYASANRALQRAGAFGPATDVLCWPHHFDLARLLVEDRDDGGEMSRTIGIGLSPGDESIDEPYWYVNHWPSPDAPRLGALSAGRWHTAGFTAAVLEAGELGRASDPERALEDWIASAVDATRDLFAG